jgi:hypothetical protein
MTNDDLINLGAIVLFFLALAAILATIGWAMAGEFRDRREALPGFEEALENRPDKLTAITYGRNGGDIRYVPEMGDDA